MSKLQRFAEAYKMLAELGYRPAAPNDGFGHITVPQAELDLDQEAREYARRFAKEEDTDHFWAGCTDYTSNRAAVLALEAFRLMNAGRLQDQSIVPKLLRKAAEEYEQEWAKEA